MQSVLQDNLPFITVVVGYNESIIEVSNVLIDTGSASSIFATDIVDALQIVPLPQDTLHVIRGIGGTEVVFKRCVDFVQVDDFSLPNFEIEIGGLNTGGQRQSQDRGSDAGFQHDTSFFGYRDQRRCARWAALNTSCARCHGPDPRGRAPSARFAWMAASFSRPCTA